MSFAKWPEQSELSDTRNLLQDAGLAQFPPDHSENPYTSLLLGLIQRLDEPDRNQWFRLVLGLAATASDAEQSVLCSVEDGASPRVVSTFGAVPGQNPLARAHDQVVATIGGRDALLSGPGSRRAPAIITVPVVRERRLRGVLVLESRRGPFRPGDLTLARAVARRLADPLVEQLENQSANHKTGTDTRAGTNGYGNLIAQSPKMLEIFELIERIAATDHPVIIQGESGTGKELVARAVHFNGHRRERPFIAENCAALSDSLLEAELFGYVKGAFTGADTDRKGFFELADGGTLFLDEVGEMNEKMQKDLLRVLQEGEVRPVGGKKVIKVDVRIICASNKNLAAMVDAGTFRKDFFYRLNVMNVELPALRDRREDIPLLVDRFLDNIAQENGLPHKSIHPDVMSKLMSYDWPGNIRELKNEIKRMVALAVSDTLTLRELRPTGAGRSSSPEGTPPRSRAERGFPSLADLEREHVLEALRRTKGNKARAAEMLGVNKATVFRKLKAYGEGS